MSTSMDSTRAQPQPLVAHFLATYPEIPHRVLDALALVDEGRIELFRGGETVGAVLTETGMVGDPASYRIIHQDHCRCPEGQAGPQRKCVHLLALEIVDALAQQAAAAPSADSPMLSAPTPVPQCSSARAAA